MNWYELTSYFNKYQVKLEKSEIICIFAPIMAIRKIKLAYLTDHSIDEIVDAHVKYVTSPRMEPDEEKSTLVEQEGKFPLWRPAFKVVEEGGKAPRRAILVPKYIFLLHEIITLCRASKGNSIQLNYADHVEVLGKVYGDMLHNLDIMGIISVSSEFEIGKKSRKISLLDWNIGFKNNIENKIVRGYFFELGKLVIKKEKKKIAFICDVLGKDFVQRYNENLSQIELVKKEDAIAYIEGREFDSPSSEQFYRSCIEDFNEGRKYITSIDDRGRIYHFLTNCPRLLRRFYNLRCDVDISNSQPLLFCDFLIKNYNIDYSVIEYIRNIDNKLLINSNEDNDIYYKGKQLCKILKDSELERTLYKDIPTDVLLYLYSCMNGFFWDDFVKTFHELDRGDVKENLFREVFYSHSRTMRYKEYGKVFAEIYPNVWHLIREMKKDAELLCNRITKVESELFHAILNQCFARDWVVVSIHDAIVVLDVKANDNLNIDELKSVILDEYLKHGLLPSLKVETF